MKLILLMTSWFMEGREEDRRPKTEDRSWIPSLCVDFEKMESLNSKQKLNIQCRIFNNQFPIKEKMKRSRKTEVGFHLYV
jgi:hypothetical protein